MTRDTYDRVWEDAAEVRRIVECQSREWPELFPDRLPQHLVADEHHADWCGEKGYVAFTVGGGCILGAALTEAADEKHLTEAYG